jgi:hypothetical protein
MFKKLRQWFNQDADELVAEEGTMTPRERAELTDYEDHKVDTGGGGYAREPHSDFERDSEPPRY